MLVERPEVPGSIDSGAADIDEKDRAEATGCESLTGHQSLRNYFATIRQLHPSSFPSIKEI